MVFIRGRQPEAEIQHYFRARGDGFVFGARGGLFEARLHTNADRAVELLLAFMEHLPPALDVRLDDWRGGNTWAGTDLATGDVRDALARVKPDLSTHAGLEVSLLAIGEQVTLTANLQLFIFARTDRWLYLLQGKGLRRVASLRPRSWALRRGEFAVSPTAEEALRLTVGRLGLTTDTHAPDGHPA